MAPYDHPDWPAFVAAVCAAPADDTVRLALADWLDERDCPAEAAFIRAGVAAPGRVVRFWPSQSVPGDGPFLFRDEDLAGLLSPRGSWAVARGFACEASCRIHAFRRHGVGMFRWHPVTRVTLSGLNLLVTGRRLVRDRQYGWAAWNSGGSHSHLTPKYLWTGLARFVEESRGVRWYPTRADALNALSDSAVGCARRTVGLPPLGAGS